MKQCPKCETRLDDDVKICLQCGYDFGTQKISFKNKLSRKAREVLVVLGVIALCFPWLYLEFSSMKRQRERTLALQEIKNNYTMQTEEGTYEDISAKYPGELDEMASFYEEFQDFVEKYPSTGADENSFIFYKNQFSHADLNATIEHQGYEFTVSYFYGDELLKQYGYEQEWIKENGIDKELVAAFCELTNLNENQLMKEIHQFMEEVGKQASYYGENIDFDRGSLDFSYYDRTLYVTYEMIEGL